MEAVFVDWRALTGCRAATAAALIPELGYIALVVAVDIGLTGGNIFA